MVKQSAADDAYLLVHRGLADFRPKRLETAKLVATLTRQLHDVANWQRPANTRIYIDPSLPTSMQLHGFLADFPRLTVAQINIETLMADVSSAFEPTAFVVVGGSGITGAKGSTDTVNVSAHSAATEALLSYRPEWQKQLATALTQQVNTAAETYRSLYSKRRTTVCVQEKPGKTSELNLIAPTAKSLSRKWQASKNQTSREKVTAIDVEPGFGYAALAVKIPSLRNRLLTTQFRAPTTEFALDTTSHLVDEIADWFAKTCQTPPQDMKELQVSIPSAAVCAQFTSNFAQHPLGYIREERMQYRDLAFGWHPAISYLEFLATPHLPAAFVYTGHFPTIHVAFLRGTQ